MAVPRIGESLSVQTALREVVTSARALTGARHGDIATVDNDGIQNKRATPRGLERKPKFELPFQPVCCPRVDVVERLAWLAAAMPCRAAACGSRHPAR